MDTTYRRISVLHTLGAIPVALLIWVLASTLATVLWFLLNSFLTVIRPEIIGFFSNILGALVGIMAAKAAVEAWLPRYSGKAVAVAIISLSLIIIATQWFLLPDPNAPVQVTAGAVTSVIVAYQSFWLGREL